MRERFSWIAVVLIYFELAALPLLNLARQISDAVGGLRLWLVISKTSDAVVARALSNSADAVGVLSVPARQTEAEGAAGRRIAGLAIKSCLKEWIGQTLSQPTARSAPSHFPVPTRFERRLT